MAPLVYAQDLSMNGTTWNGYEMGKGSGSFLLSHGDILKLTPDTFLRFQYQDGMEENGFDMLQTVEMKVSPNTLARSIYRMQSECVLTGKRRSKRSMSSLNVNWAPEHTERCTWHMTKRVAASLRVRLLIFEP